MLLGPIEGAPVEEWDQMVNVNLLGLLYCANAALPHLLEAAESSERGVADLVNISSVAGRVVRLGSGVYNATKHAVGAFSESLRQEVTQRHVRVGLVEPGAVATELAGHNRPEVCESIEKRFGDAGAARVRGHRRRDLLDGDASSSRGDQRDPGPAHRAAGLRSQVPVALPGSAGCSTSARTRLAMNRPVRTGVPLRVTSVTSTTPRLVLTSTRRPLRVATMS